MSLSLSLSLYNCCVATRKHITHGLYDDYNIITIFDAALRLKFRLLSVRARPGSLGFRPRKVETCFSLDKGGGVLFIMHDCASIN